MKTNLSNRLLSKVSILRKLGMTKINVCLFLCCFLFYSTSSANTAYTGMRNITSMQLVSEMGTGWNLSNTLDACGEWASGLNTETYWGNPFTSKAMIDGVRARGFKTLRIPTTWYQHLGGAPNYTIDPAWLNRIEEVANYAFANDMYVIINIHHDASWVVPTYANQAQTIDQLTKVWTQIANRFKNYGDYLIFETLNEPRLAGSPEEWTGGTPEGRVVLNSFHLAAVNAIRNTGGNNADRHIMVAPYDASGNDDPINDLVIPNNDARIIISWHNYSPFSFTLDNSSNGTSTWGTAADKADLDATFKKMYDKFITNGRAVVIGEFSPGDKNNTDQRAYYTDYFVKAAISNKMAPIFWDGSIFNRNTITWVYPTIVDALVNPFLIPTGYTQCASENGSFALPGVCDVAYGANGRFSYQYGKTGTITFNNATFGDPIPGVFKTGYYKSSQLIPNGAYTMKSASNVFLTATASSSFLDKTTSENGNYTKWNFVHLGNDVYEIYSVQFDGQRMEVPYGAMGDGQRVAITTYTGIQSHIQWKATKVGSTFMFEPMHDLGFALDAAAQVPGIVHIWDKSTTNGNQLFTLTSSYGIVLKKAIIEKIQLTVFPNPATDVVNIRINSQEYLVLQIFDVNGRQVFSNPEFKSELTLPTSVIGKSGIYFIKINSQIVKLLIQ